MENSTAMTGVRRIVHCMQRKKIIKMDNNETQLRKCLTTFDLILLGIGNMTGSGIYILIGSVMTAKSGPATFVSYLLAGICAFLNALSYGELCSRMPKSGSAYLYTYVAGGEFLAFTIGWSVILEYVLSVASVAKGWSGTVDTLVLGKISNGTMELFGRFPNRFGLSAYPDFLAVAIIIFFAVIIVFGPKLSIYFNSSITIINVSIIVLATSIMLTNPNKPLSFAPKSTGGFLPFGVSGVLAGAGTCFYSYIGFDAVTISSEEAINPSKSIPLANALSVSFVTLMFVVSSAALPLFVPWTQVDPRAAFTSAFKYRHINWATYVTGIGSLFGISASLFTSLYALPRLVYSMAGDGLLMAPLDCVYARTQVPVVGLAVFTALAAVLALLLDIHTLADFLSIGTLIAYTLASVVLLILRYNRVGSELPSNNKMPSPDQLGGDNDGDHDNKPEFKVSKVKEKYKRILPWRFLEREYIPNTAINLFILFASLMCCLIFKGNRYLYSNSWWAWTFLVILFIGMFVCLMVLHSIEQFKSFDTFKVPFVPLIPLFTILLNLTLIINLSLVTWIRFLVWLLFGFIIYFGYGMNHSIMNKIDDTKPLIAEDELAESMVYKSINEAE